MVETEEGGILGKDRMIKRERRGRHTHRQWESK